MHRFSIVIVCTRPYLVEQALASALAQDFGDYEIVFSDNSPEGCRELVEAIGDPRINYVRPENTLGVVPHWDFAFSQSKGEWVLILCDDDALTPNCLSSIDKVARFHSVDLIGWTRATYYDSEFWVTASRNRLLIPAITGKVDIHDSASLLPRLFENGVGLGPDVKEIAPHIPRAAWSRRLVEAVRGALGGDMFVWPCPMTSGAVAALALTPRFARIDLPLTILGHCINSAAAHYINPSTYKRQNLGCDLKLTPVKDMSVFPAAVAEAVLATQARMPDQLSRYRLNFVNYYLACENAVKEMEGRGADVSGQRDVIAAALANEPSDIQAAVARRVTGGQNIPPAARRNFITRVARRLGFKPNSVSVTVDTAKAGLSNITECAAYVGRLGTLKV